MANTTISNDSMHSASGPSATASHPERRIAELAAILNRITTMNPHRAKPLADYATRDFETCRRMTETYRRHLDDTPIRREVAVLKEILPARMEPLRDTDSFAGRFVDGRVGHSSEIWGGYVGFYAFRGELEKLADDPSLSGHQRTATRDIIEFWSEHATHAKSWRNAYAEIKSLIDEMNRTDPVLAGKLDGLEWPEMAEHGDASNVKASGVMWFLASTTHRVAGLFFDGEKLLRLGIPGLIAAAREKRSEADGEPAEYYDSVIELLELLRDSVIGEYRRQAIALGKTELAEVLGAIMTRAPRTLHEAMQLGWMYVAATRILNVGRLDVWFGPFYAADLREGRITAERAQELTDSLWSLMYEEGHNFNSRVILGGKDRRDPESCDLFALLAIEATRRLKETRPQTTLRVYSGMNPELYDAALSAIGEGCTFPMLLNDDVNIPGVAHAFDVPESDAGLYVPLGCGEFLLDHTSVCSPNSAFLSTKCLEYALHDGRDALTGLQMGPRTGNPDTFPTYDDVFRAYAQQVRFFMAIVARKHAIGVRDVAADVPFLLASVLYDDCFDRGLPLLQGVRYLDGSTEVVSFVNTADSLTAIKTLVYDHKRFSLRRVVEALDDDYNGHDDVLAAINAVPKYGNDDPDADASAQAVHDLLAAEALSRSGEINAIRRYLIVHVNNHAHVQFGGMTAASADGRRAHAPFANANNPTPGKDISGTTAMLRSLAKIRCDNHAGVVQNMKFSRRMFTEYRSQTRALLDTYFDLGGTQAMISVVSREDLLDAMENPDKYANLMVRVGGYSARFVELSRDVQREIIARTLN